MRAAELFACSGGMALGFRRAGIEFEIAVDLDPDARASYAANLGHEPLAVDALDLVRLAAAGWTPGPLDLLVADPPCTPWSRAGKRRGIDDERDMLQATCLLVHLWRPRCAVIANVPGLDDEPNWPIVQSTIGALWHSGYCVDYQRFDCADFGVPQHRVRPFWFLHPRGSPCIVWPQPTHADPATLLVIKAKLEAVEGGIAEFDDEFMAHIVLPNGQTVGSWLRPQFDAVFAAKTMPPLLEAPR